MDTLNYKTVKLTDIEEKTLLNFNSEYIFARHKDWEKGIFTLLKKNHVKPICLVTYKDPKVGTKIDIQEVQRILSEEWKDYYVLVVPTNNEKQTEIIDMKIYNIIDIEKEEVGETYFKMDISLSTFLIKHIKDLINESQKSKTEDQTRY